MQFQPLLGNNRVKKSSVLNVMEHVLGETPVDCVIVKRKCLKSKGIRNY